MRIILISLIIFTFSSYACPDLLIQNADILTIDKNFKRFAKGDISIEGNKLTYVGRHRKNLAKCAHKIIDAKGKIALPGFVDGHTHTGMLVYRGIGDDEPDTLWKYMFPLERKYMDRETAFASSLLSAVEMVRAGITLHADMYYFARDIAIADATVGLRGIIGETIINSASPDSKEPYGSLTYAETFIKDFKEHPLIIPALAPHAPYTVTDNKILDKINRISEKYHVPILMHVAEFSVDEAKAHQNYAPGKSSVETLDEIGFLSSRLTLNHCIYLSRHDINALVKNQVGCIINMSSNLKGGLDLAPMMQMRSANLKVGIGTDGPMSANSQELFSQMRLLPLIYRHHYKKPVYLKAEEIVRLATMGGAEALHLDDKLGSLEIGKLADLILIDKTTIHMLPNYSPYTNLVYAAEPHDVSHVIINGRIVLNDRQLTNDAPVNEAMLFIQGRVKKIKAEYKFT